MLIFQLHAGVSSRACTTMPQVDTDAETSSTSHLSSSSSLPDQTNPSPLSGKRLKQNGSIQIGDPCSASMHRKVQRRFEIGTSVSEAQNSVEATYRIVYCEVIDYTVNADLIKMDIKFCAN